MTTTKILHLCVSHLQYMPAELLSNACWSTMTHYHNLVAILPHVRVVVVIGDGSMKITIGLCSQPAAQQRQCGLLQPCDTKK